MRERGNGLDSHPHHHIKGERSKRNGHTNGILNPDISVEDVRNYLLDPRIYGLGSRRSFFQLASRNYRSPM